MFYCNRFWKGKGNEILEFRELGRWEMLHDCEWCPTKMFEHVWKVSFRSSDTFKDNRGLESGTANRDWGICNWRKIWRVSKNGLPTNCELWALLAQNLRRWSDDKHFNLLNDTDFFPLEYPDAFIHVSAFVWRELFYYNFSRVNMEFEQCASPNNWPRR